MAHAVRLRLAAALAALLALLPAAGPRAAEGLGLRVALTQEPGTLNPLIGTLAVENDLNQLLFSGLVRYNAGGERIPDLAQRVPSRENGDISRDGRRITYHLVHNARWHDGVPLTSADVRFTFEKLMDPAVAVSNREPYDKIVRLETPDPFTVRLVLARPYAPILDAFSDRGQAAIVPAHILRGLPDLNRTEFAAAPVGSGPYKFVAWHRGSDIVLDADPAYFRGAPRIPRITIRFLTNDNTMLVALRTHEIDLADSLNVSTYNNLGSIPGMLPAINAKAFWEHLTFNTERPPLSDVRVRRALCRALDLHELYAKVARGLGALGVTSQNPVTPWFNRRLVPYPYDPAAAERELEAAGWKRGPDGVRAKDGKRLSVSFLSTAGNATREQTEVILQQRWSAIGVDVQIKNFPAATLFAPAQMGGPFYSGNFDVALSAFIDPVPDPSRINQNAADRVPPAGNNLSRYRNAELTRLEDEAAATYDVVRRRRLYDRIQEIELSELPYYVLRWAAVIDMRDARLHGVEPALVNSTFWNVASWELKS